MEPKKHGAGKGLLEKRSALEDRMKNVLSKFKSLPRTLREVMYGFTIHELHVELRKERGHLEQLFMLVVFGDLVGLPLLPPYYSMRLLPHVLPTVNTWKRSILREKDITDVMGKGG